MIHLCIRLSYYFSRLNFLCFLMAHLIAFFIVGVGFVKVTHYLCFFFCPIEEVLSKGILDLYNSGSLLPIFTLRGCTNLTHVLYTYDIFIFYHGDSSRSSLNSFLDDSRIASGQLMNKAKNHFFCWQISSFS